MGTLYGITRPSNVKRQNVPRSTNKENENFAELFAEVALDVFYQFDLRGCIVIDKKLRKFLKILFNSLEENLKDILDDLKAWTIKSLMSSVE